MQQINSLEDLKKLFNLQKDNIKRIVSAEVKNEAQRIAEEITEEVVENELDLFEFNLFISSFGQEKLDKSTKLVQELRKNVDLGEIDLIKYENMAEEF